MRFWLRELAGWVLVVLGLFFFYLVLALLLQPAPKIIESGPVALIGIFVFRGGIHFLKVAVAARICLHAEKMALAQDRAKRGETRKRTAIVVQR